MEVQQLGPGFFAEIRGVGLADAARDDAIYAAVRAAFEEHSVLLFRQQVMTDALQAAYSRRFGPLEESGIARRGHAVQHTHEHRPHNWHAGASRAQGRFAGAREPALAHRQLLQDSSGTRVGAIGAYHAIRRW